MFIVTVNDARRRATYFCGSIELAAEKAGELKLSGAVNVEVRDGSGQHLAVGDYLPISQLVTGEMPPVMPKH